MRARRLRRGVTPPAAARGHRAPRPQRVARRSARISCSTSNCSTGSRAIPGPLEGERGLRGRARSGRADPRPAPRRRRGGRGRARPALPRAARRAGRGLSGQAHDRSRATRSAIDEAPRSAPAHVVANLPYNVGTALLVRWLGGEAWPPWWKSLTLMFQQEVAERIVAAPGTDAYGRLAVLAQWRATPEAGDEGPPLRLRAAAQGDVGGRPHRPRRAARGRQRWRRWNASPPPPSASAARCSAARWRICPARSRRWRRSASIRAARGNALRRRLRRAGAAALVRPRRRRSRRRGRRALLGPLRREHLGGRAALDHGGELLRLRAGIAAERPHAARDCAAPARPRRAGHRPRPARRAR